MRNLELENYENCWESFWKNIILDENGSINIDQLKRELADFSMVMDNVSKVYCELTSNRMSKAHYLANDVISCVNSVQEEYQEEWFKDETEEIRILIAETLLNGENYKEVLLEVLSFLTKIDKEKMSKSVLKKISLSDQI